MIQINNMYLTLGTHEVFDDISLNFQGRQHIGIVGRNGAGKSTLLKVIAGAIKQDTGLISIENAKEIAYMPQEITLVSKKTIFEEACVAFEYFLNVEQEIKEIEQKLLENSDINSIERYSYLLEEFKKFDKPKELARVSSILNGLGFKQESFDKRVDTLSVGWKMRLVLAQLLLKDADFYLFDEPTNHLDIVTQRWFFNFLKKASFGFLLVSHDRYFLDGVCDLTIELENKKATSYAGNFTFYLSEKEKQREITQAAYERQQKEIASKKATIDRFKASATKAKMAQSMMKQLDKIEPIYLEPVLPTVSLKFPEVIRAGSTILSVKNLEQSFDDKNIFNNINFAIDRGEKVALIAANGMGKTTLFNTLIGKYKQKNGTITFGHNVQHAYFEQDQLKALNPNKTIFQEVADKSLGISESTIRSFLGAFLFSGDDIYKPISVLSGGERNRVAMVIVLLQKANFLLLDEPTNHLDLYAKDSLAQALSSYPGTMLVVSHDHNFLSTITTSVFELRKNEIVRFPGSYKEYSEYNNTLDNSNNFSDLSTVKNSQAPNASIPSNVLLKEKRKELKLVENKINKIENKVDTIKQELFSADYASEKYYNLCRSLEKNEKELECLNEQWENLFLALEKS